MKIDDIFDEYGSGTLLNRLPLHRNPGLELVYLEHGHLTWQCDGIHEAVRPDSIYFTLPWHLHGSTFEMEPGHKWHFIVIRIEEKKPGSFALPPELGFDSETEQQITKSLLYAPHHAWPASPMIALLLPELVRELKSPGIMHQQCVTHLTANAVLELARIISRDGQDSKQQNQYAPRLSRLMTTLDAEYANPWTLNKMAEVTGLKKSHFTTIFQKYTGDTPITYLTRIRINKAMMMLKNTDESITSIALNCGFSTSQYFAKLFRLHTETTPSDYRRSGLPPLILPPQTTITAQSSK